MRFPLLVPDDLLAYLTVTERLDVATVAALDEAWWALPVTGVCRPAVHLWHRGRTSITGHRSVA